jgi:UDP-N-acetylmuramate dehydrogenase
MTDTMDNLSRDVSLARWNTFGVASRAEFVACISHPDELEGLIARLNQRGLPLSILGGGSNVVLRERVPGCVARINIPGIDIEQLDGGARVTAGAGVRWHDLVRYCLGQGLFGIENLALIPGRVGAAPMQNIGAYGSELADCFDSLTAYSTDTGAPMHYRRDACEFAYRDSIFKRRPDLVITSVSLRLSRSWTERSNYPGLREMLDRRGGPRSATRLAEAVIDLRRYKLPDSRRHGNAGSFFKNPTLPGPRFDELCRAIPGLPGFKTPAGVKVPAARLIELCGWKGRRLGAVGVWHRQPLVLINLGGATGRDLLNVADQIRADVAQRFAVDLEVEPRVLGVD